MELPQLPLTWPLVLGWIYSFIGLRLALALSDLFFILTLVNVQDLFAIQFHLLCPYFDHCAHALHRTLLSTSRRPTLPGVLRGVCVQRHDWIGICSRRDTKIFHCLVFDVCSRRFLHIILETLHCWLTFIGQSWQKWKRNHGVVDGAGDSASRATTDVRIVAPIGRIETPPMSIKHVEPVHDDGSSNGAMEI